MNEKKKINEINNIYNYPLLRPFYRSLIPGTIGGLYGFRLAIKRNINVLPIITSTSLRFGFLGFTCFTIHEAILIGTLKDQGNIYTSSIAGWLGGSLILSVLNPSKLWEPIVYLAPLGAIIYLTSCEYEKWKYNYALKLINKEK